LKNIVILISGRGSNLRALLHSAEAQRWPEVLNTRIVEVISNRPDAEGLAVARESGVPVTVVDHTQFPSRQAFDAALAQAIDRHDPALVVLAGFMRVLGNEFVARYQGRMLNVHPSLLPAFAGLHTHQRAIDAGVAEHGATVHFVTPTLDHGQIIAQAKVPVLPEDSASSLAARVLEQEHQLLPMCVRWFIEGRVRLEDGVSSQAA
jgi:phosphoribosylglycinamide formyltransferase-1